MRIAIAGGHGQIARLAAAALVERGDRVVGLIRDPKQSPDLVAIGAEPLVVDLETVTEEALADAIRDADALVFAAGAGPGSGIQRKDSVDRAASDACVRACRLAGVGRFIQISAMGTDAPPRDDSVFSHYLRAKAAAEQTLMDSDLHWTILRPGRLTNDDPLGVVELGRHVPPGPIPRADVAALVVGILSRPAISGMILAAVTGSVPIPRALDELP